VSGKRAADPFFATLSTEGPAPEPSDFSISYIDSNGDTVVITSDVQYGIPRAMLTRTVEDPKRN
jgi:hypothetical protein